MTKTPDWGFAFTAGHKVGDPRAKQKIGQQHAAQCVEMYKVTGKPIYLWWAYQECRAHGTRLPQSVLHYFDRVAVNLQAARDEPGIDRAIAIATELRPKKSMKRDEVYSSVSDARDKSLSVMADWDQPIKNIAADFGVSQGTVSKAKAKWQRRRTRRKPR